MEQTLVIIKPDAVQRGLIGAIISRLETRGLTIVAMKMIRMSEKLARKHYAIHDGKPFYEGLIQFITAAPVVIMVVRGPEAIGIVRSTIGVTDPAEATPGTIRADFGLRANRNLMHASDGPETARKEINMFFNEEEILDYDQTIAPWLFTE